MKVHVQTVRDLPGLVGFSGPLQAAVQFLQTNDVSLIQGDNLGDPLGRRLPVPPDAAMDVVRHD